MPTSTFPGLPDDPDVPLAADRHLEVLVVEPEADSWPATRFSLDPASSPVLMAAFAWSLRAADRPRSG